MTAWMSPVKWRLMSSMGMTWLYPPPAAPPLTPKLGPSDGSRMAKLTFCPSFASAWESPTVVVVFPSPAGVGVMAVTSTSFPSGLSLTRSHTEGVTLALYFPYSSSSSSVIPSFDAISTMVSVQHSGLSRYRSVFHGGSSLKCYL